MSCIFSQSLQYWNTGKIPVDITRWIGTAGSTLGLVALAEIGDKSQLVCMTLAARYRPLPVLFGASMAFAVLNLLAVLFGSTVSDQLPHYWVGLAVSVLFVTFGLRSLFFGNEDENEPGTGKIAYRSLFLTVFLLILVAEFGDKTQLAVAGMSASLAPTPVWAGATLALVISAGLGIWVGRSLLTRLPLRWLHRISGLVFLMFGVYAAWHVRADIPFTELNALFKR